MEKLNIENYKNLLFEIDAFKSFGLGCFEATGSDFVIKKILKIDMLAKTLFDNKKENIRFEFGISKGEPLEYSGAEATLTKQDRKAELFRQR